MKEEHNVKKQNPWVFLIEDDVFIKKAYSAKLAHEGIETKTAGDGETALQMLKSGEDPSVILLDLMLPEKNGFEVLSEIKKDSRLKDIPVLILTNLGQETDAKHGVELGAKEYLVKADTGIEDVIAKVKQYMPNN